MFDDLFPQNIKSRHVPLEEDETTKEDIISEVLDEEESSCLDEQSDLLDEEILDDDIEMEVVCRAVRMITEFQKTLDASLLQELEVMKAMGLPTYFLNSPRDYEEVKLLVELFWMMMRVPRSSPKNPDSLLCRGMHKSCFMLGGHQGWTVLQNICKLVNIVFHFVSYFMHS